MTMVVSVNILMVIHVAYYLGALPVRLGGRIIRAAKPMPPRGYYLFGLVNNRL
jgi:hypothetical protein